MKISKIQANQTPNFYQNPKQEKREFIDVLMDKVKNPDDVNNCIAVPRGIFKAYLFIMGGFALLGISGAVPEKFGKIKKSLVVAGNILNFISAIYFAKPFAVKGLSPTIKKGEENENK